MSNEILLRLTVESAPSTTPEVTATTVSESPAVSGDIGMHTSPDYLVQRGDLVLMFASSSDKQEFMANPSSQRQNRPGRFSQYGPAFITDSTQGRALGDRKIAVNFGGNMLPPGSDVEDNVFSGPDCTDDQDCPDCEY